MVVARERGHDGDAIARAAGTTLAELQQPESFVPLPVWKAVLAEVARLTGDPLAALHAAERNNSMGRWYGAVDYVVASSPSLREAFAVFARYFPIVNPNTQFCFEDVPEGMWVERRMHGTDDVELLRQAGDFGLTSTYLGFQRTTAAPWRALRVELRAPRPLDDGEHRRIFGVGEVFFEQGRDAFLVAGADLARPMNMPDPVLHQVMQEHAAALCARIPKELPFVAQAAEVLRRQLMKGEPTVTSLARELAVSERTLQRRLGEEGTPFRALLDRVREDLARSYLSSPRMSIGEVAFLLGYSETSTFHRAFVKWTGETPAVFRARQTGS